MVYGADGKATELTTFAGVAVPATLTALASLHTAWALGWYFPAGSEEELAERVFSRSEREQLGGSLPAAPITGAVAVGLAGAAGVVRVAARDAASRRVRRLAWGVAGVFLVRGVAYLPSELRRRPKDAYDKLDLMIYSPLCLLLSLGTAVALRQESAA